MRVLITNAQLKNYAGTEVVVRDLSFALQRLGHEPVVYSPLLGAVAAEIRNHGVHVTDQISEVQAPDVIHGHHHPVLIQALTRFSQAPAIYVCHGSQVAIEEPFYFPRILRYVAVDGLCRKRIESIPEIPSDRISVIPNAVDLARFQPRPPLPSKPKSALIFSNYANRSSHLPTIRRACRDCGLTLDVLGLQAGTAVGNPESILPRYDVVFAKARCALEAMAVGNAVVLCDFYGSGPMVTSENWADLRALNFGLGACLSPLDPDVIRTEIERYDANDAAAVSRRVRNEASLEDAAARWVALYSSVLDEFHSTQQDLREELRATGAYLARWDYGKRIEWESQQLDRVGRTPVIGSGLRYFARRLLRTWGQW